jgi:hypothetical protein
VELYLHSPNIPSWRGAQGEHRDNFTFTFTRAYASGCSVAVSKHGNNKKLHFYLSLLLRVCFLEKTFHSMYKSRNSLLCNIFWYNYCRLLQYCKFRYSRAFYQWWTIDGAERKNTGIPRKPSLFYFAYHKHDKARTRVRLVETQMRRPYAWDHMYLHLLLVPRSRMRGAVPPPPICLHCVVLS